MSYTTVKIGKIITQIAKITEIPGYTEGVIEIFFPEEEEMTNFNVVQEELWISENNKRMEAICKFLNENNL